MSKRAASAARSGPLPWWALAAYFLVLIAGLCIVFAATGSADAQIVVMLAYLFGVGPLVRRFVPTTRDYEVDTGEPWSKPKQFIVLGGAFALVMVGMIGLSRGLQSAGLYPGQWAIFTAIFLMPLALLGNKYGRLPPDEDTGELGNPEPGRSPTSADEDAEEVLRVLGVGRTENR